jgi:hypothetical protein
MVKKPKTGNGGAREENHWAEPRNSLSDWDRYSHDDDSELAEILDDALDKIEIMVRRRMDNRSHRFGEALANELRDLEFLLAERLAELAARYAHFLPYDQDSPPAVSDESREVLFEQSYEEFLRQNPGKAHFTRAQWERAVRTPEGPYL